MKPQLGSYTSIAIKVGVPLCTSCTVSAYYHYKGMVDDDGVAHWHRERITRAGIYEFLKLCWTINNRGEPAYRRVYGQSTFAMRTAREIGVGIPASVARNDRLRVRSQMPALPSTDPIYKWAHKENV